MMNWRFNTTTRRLHVSNAQLDFRPVRALLGLGRVPTDIEAIIYSTPSVTYVVCGFILQEWVAGRDPAARRDGSSAEAATVGGRNNSQLGARSPDLFVNTDREIS